jgi:HAD superfamily hydrolase (TIGR01509 family)
MIFLSSCPLRYKALIFDCDGVLVDSEPLHCLTWQEVFRSHGVEMATEAIMRFVGMSSPQTMAALVDEQHLFECPDRDLWIREKRELFLRYVDERLEEIRGVRRFLDAMARRIPLAMATGCLAETYSPVLHRMGWTEVFGVKVGADDVAHPKPHPEIYLTTLERLGLPASACLAFEDSAPGVEAARAAGLDVVGIASTHDAAFLVDRGARAVLSDFDDENKLCDLLG